MPVDPKMVDARSVFSLNDFPGYLQVAGVSRVVYPELMVRADGSIRECRIALTSKDDRLDKLTCRILLSRAKLKPAIWMDGTPVIGILRGPVGWLISDDVPPPEAEAVVYTPDLDLAVVSLPERGHRLALVEIALAIDENGKIIGCAEKPRNPKTRLKYFPELAPIACQQATAHLTLPAAKDEEGNPIRSVQTATVRFIANH